MRKLPSRKLLAILVAGALFVPHTGFTLGLGEIEVNSALNQKLKADIELLSATPEDAENIIIKLASRKEFSRAGLDRPYALSDLRFKTEIIDDVPHIKVSSGSPIREPFLNFLVEIDWPNGHLIREYTVLLDPPVFMTKAASTADSNKPEPASESRPSLSDSAPSVAAPSVVVPVPAVTSSATPAVGTQSSAASAFRPAPVVQQQTPINQLIGSYRVKSGDTAWSLADAMRPNESVTVPQMMFALLRANPESFINENIHGLKRGYILRAPDAAQIAAISQSEARAMMSEHWALWRQYQQSLAGGQPVTAMPADGAAASSAEGSGDTAANDNAHLAIVSAGSGASTAGSKDPSEMTAQELRAELALARERVETERVEKEALQSRINTLEQYAEQREGLLTVEDKELSGVQSLNTPADGEMVEETAADTEATDEQAMDSQVEMAEGATDEPMDQDVAEQGTSESAAEDAVFTDEVTEQDVTEQDAMEQAVDEEMATTDAATSQLEDEQRTPTDPLTKFLNNPVLLAAAGGGLLLLAAIIGLIVRRRKKGSGDDEPTVKSGFADIEGLADDIAKETAEDEVVENSLAGDQAYDDENESDSEPGREEDTDMAEPDTSAEAANDEPRDDVIAEADVYLAYGIYQQAEDLLNQAIAENPDRNDYRVKLAETHYAGKNAESFVEVAGEIKSRIDNDESPEWKKVLTMGQDLCADNPMFNGAAPDLGIDEAASQAPVMDFDLGDEGETSDADSAPGEELELPEMIAGTTGDEEMSAAPAEEIEFDISDTGAIEETESAEDEFSLDIDTSELDIDITDAADTDVVDADVADADAAESSTEIEEESIDLSAFDIGLDDEDTVEKLTEDLTEDTASGDTTDNVNDDIDIDFGLDEDEVAIEEDSVEEEEVTLDLSDEIPAEPQEEPLDEPQADTQTDTQAIELDTDESQDSDVTEDEAVTDASTATVNAAANDGVDEEDFDLSSLDDVDEISTKLDLARAYLDMGDREGTRGILEEVLVDGNDEQKQEANELMEKLA